MTMTPRFAHCNAYPLRRLYSGVSRIHRSRQPWRLRWRGWGAWRLLRLLFETAQDPQRPWQSGEVGEQCEDERGRGDDAELPHRRQVGERESEKATRVDERGE